MAQQSSIRVDILKRLLFFLLPFTVTFNTYGADKTSPPEAVPLYTMWMGGTKGRHAFDQAVVWLALEKSREGYGPFQLRTYQKALNFERERIESARADTYNIHIAPYYSVTLENTNTFIRVKEPIIEGFLGYRQLVIRKQDLDKFAQIQSKEQLAALTAGQGIRWPDVEIMRNNQLKVIESLEINSLFAMLNKKRFDYIPMGANEAAGTLDTVTHVIPDLTIAPNIILYYPLSIFIFVTGNNPQLAERLESGLRKAKSDGSYESLFQLHFSHILEQINQPGLQLITLENTKVSAEGSSKTPKLIKPSLRPDSE
ncbi:hypothetical protein [Teredinibacter haidensis]|uniref:hypothetical protein n=1 Tax=Teredinibacter haidensis TaxID=2731755 RepID=UPI000948BFB6|nr:hypothetical protein [Teredinibacter haidensis]